MRQHWRAYGARTTTAENDRGRRSPCGDGALANAARRVVVLDGGANVEADANQLVSFAIMGEAFSRGFERQEKADRWFAECWR